MGAVGVVWVRRAAVVISLLLRWLGGGGHYCSCLPWCGRKLWKFSLVCGRVRVWVDSGWGRFDAEGCFLFLARLGFVLWVRPVNSTSFWLFFEVGEDL